MRNNIKNNLFKIFLRDGKASRDIIIFILFLFLFMLFLLSSGFFNVFFGSLEFGIGLMIGGAGILFSVTYFSLKYYILRANLSREIESINKIDKLTGLINGHEFRNRIASFIEHGRNHIGEEEKIMCVILSIDRFKTVNQSLGYNIGDEVIIEVSNRIKKTISGHDILARINGDEFGILIYERENRIYEILNKLMDSLKVQYLSSTSHNFSLSISIGAAYCTKNYDLAEAETLLKKAQIAMNYSKKSGGGQLNIYHNNMESKKFEDLQLESELRESIKNNQLVVYYQPKYDLKTGDIIGAEALVRWNNPRLAEGLISPVKFIKIAEEIGFISDIGNYVLKKSCEEVNEWKKRGKDIKIAVNISVKQFKESDLYRIVKDTIDFYDIPFQNIELEITESLLMDNIDSSIKILNELKRLGVRISIDDFGTGYSSLAYLRQIPANTIKIDRSFVKNIDSDNHDKAIVSTIIYLAHSLDCDVVAEGVETERQSELLQQNNCDYAQGFYFSKPVTSEEFRRIGKL